MRKTLIITRATATDVEDVLRLLQRAAACLQNKGINQWRPEEFTQELLIHRVRRGELIVARSDGEPAGTLALQTSDVPTWGSDDGRALYVHSLAVSRQFAGQRVGEQLLRWAEAEVVSQSRSSLRLDCWSGNHALRRYYTDLGFQWRGDRQFTHWSCSLFERPAPAPGSLE